MPDRPRQQARPRVLLLTPVIPSDRGNGLAMRAGLLLTGLAQSFSVDVAVAPAPPPDPVGAQFTTALCAHLQILDAELAAGAAGAAGAAAAAGTAGTAGTADAAGAVGAAGAVAAAGALLATPQARERAAALRPLPKLCRGAPPGWGAQVTQLAAHAALVVVFRLYLAPLIDAILDDPDRPAVLIDVDELDSDTERLLGRAQEAERFERLERYYLPRADHVLTCAAPDAHAIAARNALSAVTAIPNAVPVPGSVTQPSGACDLLFVGNLSYEPNARGARWLCEAVLPLLGEVSVVLAGSRPGAQLRELGRDPRVTVVADPDDVAPLYAAARVAVVPLLSGGGSRIKLIEALAHARPVVATSVGAQGQPWGRVGTGAGVLVADDPEAFAAACGQLLADPERARTVGEAGRAAVTARAVTAVVAPRIAAVGEEAVRRRAVSSTQTQARRPAPRARAPRAAAVRSAPRAASASTAPRPSAVQPLLTAALIVRDEEAVLGACLDSLVGVADEVVIVDTGSSDATVEIARAHGAQVLQQPWADDFSTARNHGLDHARGAWILYIDADERVAPVDREELHRRLASSCAMAMRILLRPTMHATPYYEYRLWRSDPRIRFEGVMHERVVGTIHAAAEEDGRSIDDWSGLLLEHVGYEGDQTRKHERNLPLLQAQLGRDPRNIYNWRHLAQVLEGLGRPDEAAQALTQATELALAQPTASIDGGLAWGELVRMRHARGEDVARLLELGRERWPQHWLIRWMEGIIAQEAGRLSEAESCFRSLLAVDLDELPKHGIAYDQRIFREWAYASLGLVLFRAGRYAEAAGAYAQAESYAPEELEYRVKRGLAQARAGLQGV